MPQGNKDNLIPNSERTPEERREFAIKGGLASGKARRDKKLIQEALQRALKGKYTVGESEEKIGGYDALALSMITQALGGSVQAFKEIRDTIGEKPTDNVNIESEQLMGINIKFVDKSKVNTKKEQDPKIVGDYTPPSNVNEN